MLEVVFLLVWRSGFERGVARVQHALLLAAERGKEASASFYLVACSIHRVASTQPRCPRSFRGTKGFRSKGIERLEKDATRCDEKYRLTRIGLSMGLELRTKMCEWFLEGYRSICILQSVLSFYRVTELLTVSNVVWWWLGFKRFKEGTGGLGYYEFVL